jgi:cytochrome c2
MSKFLRVAALAVLAASPAAAEKLGLGRPALPEEVAAWDIDVRPDGLGLPEGSGDVLTGEDLYINNCAMCHGDFGEAVGRWPVLAGGQGTLSEDRPNKTIGSYWPYLSTVWDYVHRAMPFGNARTLSNDDIYAITAYILYLNDIVDEDFTLSKENFTEVAMPNAGGFFMDDRDTVEVPAFTVEPCMENCKETVEITARAAVVDVTPEDTLARTVRQQRAAAAAGGAAPAAEGAPAEEAMAAVEEAPAEEAAAEEAAAAAPDPELVAAGERVFRQCRACHKVGEDARSGTGPALNGVFGHPAAAVEGFRYSPAMQEAAAGGLVWTAETLDAYLTKPRDFVSGTRMSFAGLRKEEDRAAVIAYLSTFAE